MPDWRSPDAASLASDWKEMKAPGNWESQGLPDFDGVVWFTRRVEWPAAPPATSLTLGRVGNAAEVWVNGKPLAAPPATHVRRASAPLYPLVAGVVGPGTNTITIRIRNNRGDGGFLGPPEAMSVQRGKRTVPLAGTWRYRVERQTNAAPLYTKSGELAAHLAFATSPAAVEKKLSAAESTPDVIVRLGVIPHQLKFDKSELTVAPNQLVELVLANPDVMQHNFLLGTPGSLAQIGSAADALMAGPNGMAQQYVPTIPQVLFSTTLVDPGQTITVHFRAPAEPGRYPYVCTFPGHWRVMNGVLRVVLPRTGPGTGRAESGSPGR